ncbi:hypothetical protein IKF21_02830, partial [Candidatus Saccharibacteria bacterium]|nr:hypothetical protein [Candidatus Saccharibacteria bacterium]
KVATKTSATSASPTTAFSTTYGVYTTAIQAAGEYVGKVKYVLVHPNTAPKPVVPLAEDDCPANSICYAPNAGDIEGSMDSISDTKITKSPTAGVQKRTVSGQTTTVEITSNSIATFIVPNYSRSGYGFAGWSPDFNATSSSTIYGPNESINVGDVSDRGIILYPVWVASTGNLQNWNGCNSLTKANYDSTTGKIDATLSSVTALTDQRDGNVYTVARLADDNCWMVENLRLNAENTRGETNKGLAQGYKTYSGVGINYGSFIGLADSEEATFTYSDPQANSIYYYDTQTGTASININNSNEPGFRMPRYNNDNIDRSLPAEYRLEQTGEYYQWYGYGNYYSWPAVMANTVRYSGATSTDADGKTSETAGTSICPTGWRLPYGRDTGNGTIKGGFSYLDVQLGGTGTESSSSTDPTGNTMSVRWRSFPNNFISSGELFNSILSGRDAFGYYWSSTARHDYFAYGVSLSFDNEHNRTVHPGTTYRYKSEGLSVRCLLSTSP